MAANTIRKAEASSSGKVVALPAKAIRSRDEELPSTDEWGKDPLDAAGEAIDRVAHAALARLTSGLSPMALAGAVLDWAAHLASSPGKQLQLVHKGARKAARLNEYLGRTMLGRDSGCCIEPLPQDRRFAEEAWQKWPYNVISQAFLLNQQWWHNATTGVDGVTKQHERVVEFASRQVLDTLSPSNFLLTNPVALTRTLETGGTNLVQGFRNWMEDYSRTLLGTGPVGTEHFQVGRNVAATPGKVIFRNRLIELIQYAPTTDKVRPEPVLIVPAWIMKYYILDLSPENSLVRYLRDQGFTVFILSWKNPVEDDRALSFDDYRTLGFLAALDIVRNVVPDQKVHAVGYCLGGTLLSIAAAAMARDGDEHLATMSLFAAQVDFSEAGELGLFINESQVHFLEDLMRSQGYLDTRQMAGTFQILRSSDLIWSRIMRDYIMGERAPLNDLMAWNADATRMPAHMHSEYLRQLYLNNDLAEGRFKVDGRPVALSDIRVPIFAVGTERDHVAPWRSAYKIHLLTDTAVTFLLTSGGHNAGIVSEPGHRGRRYSVMARTARDRYLDPETWLSEATRQEGSWWPEWIHWLEERSGAPTEPPHLGSPNYTPVCDAPGTYVLQR
jgi:polyhydroxyalkanoate synthase